MEFWWTKTSALMCWISFSFFILFFLWILELLPHHHLSLRWRIKLCLFSRSQGRTSITCYSYSNNKSDLYLLLCNWAFKALKDSQGLLIKNWRVWTTTYGSIIPFSFLFFSLSACSVGCNFSTQHFKHWILCNALIKKGFLSSRCLATFNAVTT